MRIQNEGIRESIKKGYDSIEEKAGKAPSSRALAIAWNRFYNDLRAKSNDEVETHGFSTDSAKANMSKNRYRDVLPYDHSRVKLRRESSSDDYINASIVPAAGGARLFILAQGPLRNTCADFWQMVWEQESTAVIMLNRLEEKSMLKCWPYYPGSAQGAASGGATRQAPPTGDTVRFPIPDGGGEFRVELEATDDSADGFTVRRLKLVKRIKRAADAAAEDVPTTTNGTSAVVATSPFDNHADVEELVILPNAVLPTGETEKDHSDTAEAETNSDERQNDEESDEEEDNDCEETGSESALHFDAGPAPQYDEEERSIIHFQFYDWPDFGVPPTDHFLSFLLAVRKAGVLDITCNGPAVVHCSAGIGRSGTFVMVDAILAMVKIGYTENYVNIEERLLEMRQHRMGLVQTCEQLRFLWSAVIDALTDEKWKDLLELSNYTRMSPPSSPQKRPMERATANQMTSGGSYVSIDNSELERERKRSRATLLSGTGDGGWGSISQCNMSRPPLEALNDDEDTEQTPREQPAGSHQHPPPSPHHQYSSSVRERRRERVEVMRKKLIQSEASRAPGVSWTHTYRGFLVGAAVAGLGVVAYWYFGGAAH